MTNTKHSVNQTHNILNTHNLTPADMIFAVQAGERG